MANAIPDLWPDIEQSNVVPPLAILREQAAALGAKTGHLLEGRVQTRTDEGGNFVHSFYVVAPTLDNYTYRLFSISHGADPYPITLPNTTAKSPLPRSPLLKGAPIKLTSEGDLINYIREVLNSEKTKRIVGSLLAQIKAAT